MGKQIGRMAAVLLTAALVITGCGGAKTSTAPTSQGQTVQQKKIKIGYLNVMDDAQAMLAKDAGLYAKNGLDVELQMFDSGTDLIKGIVSGELQGGVLGFTNAVTWATKGADIKVVGGAQMGYHSLLVRKDSGITKVSDLKGKKIASQQKGSTADIVWNGVVLPQNGLTAKDVTMVYTSPANAIQALAAGQVDAAFVFEPYEQIASATSAITSIYEIGKVWPFPCMVVITSGKLLNEDRATVDAILTAQNEAIQMLQKDPKGSAKLLTSRFIKEESLKRPDGTAVLSVDVVQKAIESQMFHSEITPDEIKRMQDVIKLMLDQKIIDKEIQAESFLDLTWQRNHPMAGMKM
ncbi:MAG TPA: ABC transporter substrate-binding protein [Symbiobacteriaceae bacterium]|nr:ABC transporter substrate-binding protein [Symbiobacteriaceae bacterium]